MQDETNGSGAGLTSAEIEIAVAEARRLAISPSHETTLIVEGIARLFAGYRDRRIDELLEATNRYLERARYAEHRIELAKDAASIEIGIHKEYRRRAEARLAEGSPNFRRVRHLKRGSTYKVLGTAKVKISKTFHGGFAPLTEADELVVYQAETDGTLWVRFPDEFENGRFETIAEAADAVSPHKPRHVNEKSIRSAIHNGLVDGAPLADDTNQAFDRTVDAIFERVIAALGVDLEHVGWRWRSSADDKWQFVDGQQKPSLGLPKAFNESVTYERVYAQGRVNA